MKILASMFAMLIIAGLTASAGEILSTDGALSVQGPSELLATSGTIPTADSTVSSKYDNSNYDSRMKPRTDRGTLAGTTSHRDGLVSYGLPNASDRIERDNFAANSVDVSAGTQSTGWNWDRPIRSGISQIWKSAPQLLMQACVMALSFAIVYSSIFFMFNPKS